MLTDARIAFVGSGAMAEAMIQGLLKQKIAQAANIIAAGPAAERGAGRCTSSFQVCGRRPTTAGGGRQRGGRAVRQAAGAPVVLPSFTRPDRLGCPGPLHCGRRPH